jgi:hypothetical protein
MKTQVSKSDVKPGEKARKPYVAPKLNELGKIERLTAGSGAPVCYFPFIF